MKDNLKKKVPYLLAHVLAMVFLSLCCVMAQAQKITLKRSNISVEDLLNHLRNYSAYDFFYSKDMMANTKPISLDVKDMPLTDVLTNAFKDQPLTFTIKDRTIIIRTRQKTNIPTVQTPLSGYIRDDQNNLLTGVTVTLNIDKKEQLTTLSDEKGYFEFPFVAGAKTLELTYIGFDKKIIPIDQRKVYQISLMPHQERIEDVVVTGMFSRPIENFTGSATTITGEELKQVSAIDIFAGVAAMDPAFNITVNNVAGGNINQTPQVQIRGQNSFPTLGEDIANNPNEPLFVLDGFEVTINRIRDLDINLIHTIVLLKDASATAIYGSRGANGVMVVTTKPPKPGKMNVSLINDFSVTTPNLSVYNLLDARQKLAYEQLIGVYNSEDPNEEYALNQLYNSRVRAVEAGINTDWRNLAVQTGIINRTTLSLSGGDTVIRYNITGGSNFQNGVMKGQDRTIYQAQFDFSYLLNNIRFSNSARFYQTTANESPYGSFATYLDMNPYWSPYDENNNVKYFLEDFAATGDFVYTRQQTNPLYNGSLGSINRTKNLSFQNNFSIRYDVLPSLFVESRIGVIRGINSTDNFLPGSHTSFLQVADPAQRGSYTIGETEQFSYEFATFVNFRKNWNKHLLFNTLSFELGSDRSDGYSIRTVGFASDNLDHLLYATQYDPNAARPSGSENTTNRVGFLLNGNYSYDNRYLLDVSLRRDGSSLYGTERQFGNFWSLGLGWNLHNEHFLKNTKEINRFRIRSTYGVTGSLAIPAYTALTQYGYNVNTIYDGNIDVNFSNMGNPDLSWQQKNELNIGLDLEMFDTRLSFRTDYYHAITSDAITLFSLAPSVGASSYYENFGTIQNQGIEFALQYKLINNTRKNFSWTIFANGLHNSNRLLEISDNLQSLNNRLNSASDIIPNFLYQEGQSTTAIYAVPSLGIDPATGREVYRRLDGSATYLWSAADKIASGDTQPKLQGSFGSNVFYKGFELGLIMSYRWGGQIYNQTLVDRVENINPLFNVDIRAYEVAWTAPGDNALYRRINLSGNELTFVSTRFVENENYLSLTSLSIGYLFTKQAFVKKSGFNSLRIRALTNELMQFSSVQIERGTDNPFARTFSLSINASF